MSRAGTMATMDHDYTQATAATSLSRIAAWLRRHGHPVQGEMYIHALEALVKPEPEPTLDAGWPNPEKNR